MPVNYLTEADVDAVMDARVRKLLFDDTEKTGGAGYNTKNFTRACELASTLARAAASNAGYEVNETVAEGETTSDNDMVKTLALTGFVRMAFGRKGREVPPPLEALLGQLLEASRVGDLPIPDLAPSKANAVSGGDFEPITGDSSNASVRRQDESGGRFDELGDFW